MSERKEQDDSLDIPHELPRHLSLVRTSVKFQSLLRSLTIAKNLYVVEEGKDVA